MPSVTQKKKKKLAEIFGGIEIQNWKAVGEKSES